MTVAHTTLILCVHYIYFIRTFTWYVHYSIILCAHYHYLVCTLYILVRTLYLFGVSILIILCVHYILLFSDYMYTVLSDDHIITTTTLCAYFIILRPHFIYL